MTAFRIPAIIMRQPACRPSLAPTAHGVRRGLAWHDELDGRTLDRTEWNLRTGERFASIDRAENVGVADGLLRLALMKEKGCGLDHTSGGVISTREFRHGSDGTRFRSPVGGGWNVFFRMRKNGDRSTGDGMWAFGKTIDRQPRADHAAIANVRAPGLTPTATDSP